MNSHVRIDISNLLRARKENFTLPAELYVSQEAFDTDLEVFFRRHWIVVGIEADVPEPGDVKTIDIGNTSILIVRDDDGIVRAFHNVCRHRGARLVQDENASVGRLICPYHQWSYDLDGSLVHAAQMGKDFDKSCFSLRPVHLKSIAGIIMVCIADDAPEDIADLAAALEPRLAPLDLANAKIAFETTIIEAGNWKLSVDNNRECYHCSGSHPELCVSLNGLDIGFDPDESTSEELADWHAHVARSTAEATRWEAAGYPSALIEEMTGRATIFRTQRFAIADAGEAHTLDTRAACAKLLGSVIDNRLGDLHVWTHNSWNHFFGDHAVVSYIIPLSPDQTSLRTVWLVNRQAEEGRDYDLKRLTEVWAATNSQDADLVAIAQKGVKTTGYAPGPLSGFVERLVNINLNWYVERLKAHGF